ncbi:MAG: penicillin-binding transpeptidase domain-containing protein, partial [Actinomycetota bacterium]
MTSRGRAARLMLLSVCLPLPACTVLGGSGVPPVAEAADGFIAAWNGRDTGEMNRYFDGATRKRWTEQRLDRHFDRAFRGAVTSFEVSQTAEVEEPSEEAVEGSEEVVVRVPYAITYRSDAVDEPGRFEGRFMASLDDAGEEQRWTIAWGKSMLWPRIEGGSRFEVSTTLPKRGPLLDRRGRRLAVGPSGSRSYPFGPAGGTTIGHIAPLTRKGLKDAGDGLEVGDLAGASGLEKAYEEELAGEPATKLELVDRRGKVLEVVARTGGVRGKRVRTTIDVRVQRAAEAAFGSTTGGAVVLDPRTGDLLAAVDSSEFNPGFYVGVEGIEIFNRPLSGLYPPGSAMKVVTASAALESEVVTPQTTVTGPGEYKGVRNFESGTFGTIPFSTAVQNSVNTAFAQVAEKLGARRLTRFARRFGFVDEPAMPLGAATSSFPLPEDESDLMWGSIGQAQVLATP